MRYCTSSDVGSKIPTGFLGTALVSGVLFETHSTIEGSGRCCLHLATAGNDEDIDDYQRLRVILMTA